MEFFNLMLAEKIGKVLAMAVTEKKYNRYELVKKWLLSKTYADTIDFAVHLCSQAKSYILSEFEKEYSNNLPSIDEDSPYYEDDLYWFGYIMAYWYFLDGTTGQEIVDKIDINNVLDNYEILHTISVQHAIDKIKEVDVL